MFKSARLKLTAWYLAIIMLVSVSFSLVLYKGVSFEFSRSFTRIERRLRAGEKGFKLPAGPQPVFREDLEEARKRVLAGLFYANGIILTLSAAAGYYLAGRTLKPIEKALEEQKRFVADASHELRTPLTALKTSIEVALRDKKMSLEEAKKVISSNLEDVDGLQSLSNNLLTLANLQSNGQNLVFGDVDLGESVESVRRKILPLAEEKNIKMEFEVSSRIIQANKEGLEEMLLIFLDNAVKYTPKGGRVIVKTEASGKNVLIKIKDAGVGIAKEDLPHIFDRFYRADKSRATSGFGLGLALAKRIIETHRGSVAVSSILDKGTTFTIKLPPASSKPL